MKKGFLLLAFLCLITIVSKAQISLTQFAQGLALPVDIKSCGDDRLFVLEQKGNIQLLDTAGVMYSRPFLNIQTRVQLSSEQGLLGLAFPDDYATSGYFYVNYTAKPNGETRISRFRNYASSPDSADPNSEEILLRVHQPYSNHNGGHLAFGPDGYLYIGMGDGGSGGDPGNRAQNTDSLLGKMLRIIVDPSDSAYAIPPSNPFARDTVNGRPEIWAVGVRNPWRWSFDKVTGDMWIGDVGQGAQEEIDFIPAGTTDFLNLGWNCREGSVSYPSSLTCGPATDYMEPVRTYTHASGCSVTGGYIYRGGKYNELYGKYFYTDYCQSNIHYLEPNGSGGFADTDLGNLGASSVISFGTDKNGELYCGTSGGNIYRFNSADCTPVAAITNGMDSISDCGAGSVILNGIVNDEYFANWYLDGALYESDTTQIQGFSNGTYVLEVINGACVNRDTIYVSLVPPLSISFSGLDTLYCVYNSTAFLLPNVLGGTFSGPGVNLASFNPAVAGEGTHTVSYTYTDPTGCTYSASQNVRVDLCLGVSENNWLNTVSVFPNPSNGSFNLQVYSRKDRSMDMLISNNIGQIVSQESFVVGAGESTISIDTKLPAGIYFVKLTEGENILVKKIVVQ